MYPRDRSVRIYTVRRYYAYFLFIQFFTWCMCWFKTYCVFLIYRVSIRIGEHDADTELDCSPQLNCSRTVDFRIAKMIPHPRYSTEDKSNDIELIRVHGNIPFDTPFVKPICLPFGEEYGISEVLKPKNNQQFATRKGIVAGWGRTKWSKLDTN